MTLHPNVKKQPSSFLLILKWNFIFISNTAAGLQRVKTIKLRAW